MLKRLLLLSLLPFCSYAEELPAPVKAIEKQGITIIKPFDAPGGMKGWLGKYQDMGVASTSRQTANMPFPAICMTRTATTSASSCFKKNSTRRRDKRCGRRWPAPTGCRMATKTPPSCCMSLPIPSAYCKLFWQQSRPWVDAGKVQIRTLLVGVIKPESPVTAAAILASKDPAKTWHDYEQSNGKMALTIPKLSRPRK